MAIQSVHHQRRGILNRQSLHVKERTRAAGTRCTRIAWTILPVLNDPSIVAIREEKLDATNKPMVESDWFDPTIRLGLD